MFSLNRKHRFFGKAEDNLYKKLRIFAGLEEAADGYTIGKTRSFRKIKEKTEDCFLHIPGEVV